MLRRNAVRAIIASFDHPPPAVGHGVEEGCIAEGYPLSCQVIWICAIEQISHAINKSSYKDLYRREAPHERVTACFVHARMQRSTLCLFAKHSISAKLHFSHISKFFKDGTAFLVW